MQAQPSDNGSFPESNFGIYIGMLQIQSAMGEQRVPMEFHLKPTDTVGRYAYTLVYGTGEKKQERKYYLVESNKERGEYLIDENNGILLQAQHFNNRLYSMYAVAGNILTTFITFQENSMLFEITVASQEKAKDSKEESDGTEVSSYPIFTRQHATLYKQ